MADGLVTPTGMNGARVRKVSRGQRGALRAYAWLDERFRIRNAAEAIGNFYMQINMQLPRSHTEKYKLRSIWYWYPMYTLGSLSLLSFIVATVSGLLLTLYYTPSNAPYIDPQGPYGVPFEDKATYAWQSVGFIMLKVPFGFMIRAVHFWSAMVMVAAVFMHMKRTYWTSCYKKPRELNWLLGISLFGLTILLGYSGYLLPWSQLSYWAATIGLELSSASPLIGKWLAAFMFGGSVLGQHTLTRMYILHIFILPILTYIIIGVHITLVWIQGIAEPH